MPNFSTDEQRIRDILGEDVIFHFDGEEYKVVFSAKPTCANGEPKTDIFVRTIRLNGSSMTRDFKISYKKSNADFLENKMSAERAEQLFGANWRNIITQALQSIQRQFDNKKLIFKHSHAHTEEGCFTIGWKFELLGTISGELSGRLNMTHEQLMDVYAGTNQSIEKKNAIVNGVEIENSGVAEYILVGENFNSAQAIIDALQSINEYTQRHPQLFFACKALNYRSLHNPPKWDGDRPLSAFVAWKNIQNKLHAHVITDAPLTHKGNQQGDHLIAVLESLQISTTRDISRGNVDDYDIVHE